MPRKRRPPPARPVDLAEEDGLHGDCPECARQNVRLFRISDLDTVACLRCTHITWMEVMALQEKANA